MYAKIAGDKKNEKVRKFREREIVRMSESVRENVEERKRRR